MEHLVLALGERVPSIAPDAFVAHGAVIVGDVSLGARSSVWYHAVLRGDGSTIVLGEASKFSLT